MVSQVRDADLGLPTPCAGWSLADLLQHMVAHHRGFARALAGQGLDADAWAAPATGAEALRTYDEATHEVYVAFERTPPETRIWIPEITTDAQFDAARSRGFHVIDYVVHTWDVANTVGVPYELDDRVASTALRIALEVPDTEGRHDPRSLFAPALPAPDGASTLDRILMHLGRDPQISGQALGRALDL